MQRRIWLAMAVTICMMVAVFAAAGEKEAEETKVPLIPGLTAPDNHPQGCVDCHQNHPEKNKDHRLTTALKKWQTAVPAKRVAMGQAAAPAGVTLQGKHPDVSAHIKVVPTDCLKCHGKSSKQAPPFSKLVHAIHLTGGKDNYFITNYNGHCTHCHKLDQKTGAWRLGRGKEN